MPKLPKVILKKGDKLELLKDRWLASPKKVKAGTIVTIERISYKPDVCSKDCNQTCWGAASFEEYPHSGPLHGWCAKHSDFARVNISKPRKVTSQSKTRLEDLIL